MKKLPISIKLCQQLCENNKDSTIAQKAATTLNCA